MRLAVPLCWCFETWAYRQGSEISVNGRCNQTSLPSLPHARVSNGVVLRHRVPCLLADALHSLCITQSNGFQIKEDLQVFFVLVEKISNVFHCSGIAAQC